MEEFRREIPVLDVVAALPLFERANLALFPICPT